MFRRNTFTPLYTKSETSAHVQIAITFLYILLANILTWHQLENFCNFLVEISTFKQTISFIFRRDEFGKRKVQNLQTRIHFWKSYVNKLITSLINFIYQKVSQCKFQFHIMQETCK